MMSIYIIWFYSISFLCVLTTIFQFKIDYSSLSFFFLLDKRPKCPCSIPVPSEIDCKVKVEYIVADFASDNQTELYKTIEAALADKEIGLLGICFSFCIYIYVYDWELSYSFIAQFYTFR